MSPVPEPRSVRYRARPLAAACDAERAYLALAAAAPHSFWLDAGVGAEGGFSYVGAGELLLEAERRAGDAPGEEHARLEARLQAIAVEAAEVPGFGGGLVGWLGYEYGARLMGVPAAEDPPGRPAAAWLLPDRVLCIDHGSGAATLLEREGAPADPAGDWAGRAEVLGALPLPALPPARSEASGPSESPAPSARAMPPAARWRHSDARYIALVEACQAAIGRGDAYQICLTNEAVVEAAFDPVEVYRRLRRLSPSHHGGLLRFGDAALASASPETFLSVDGNGLALTRPIKGTRPRGADPTEDAALSAELRADEKELAENLMIVDLMRNDLTRVAEPGTVEVTELFGVESYPQVHQLVSTVRARLPEGAGLGALLAAAFPAGSMTGAPKHRAMTLLAGWEEGPRGTYAGAFGYRDARGGAELAMVIRSIALTPERARIGAGGGITALSRPAAELAEAHLKAAALLRVLGECRASASAADSR